MSRLTFITLLSIAMLVLASLVHWQDNETDATTDQQANIDSEADFFMSNAVTTQFNTDGTVDHTLKYEAIKHFPANNFTDATNPEITFVHPNGTTWHISAEQGRMTEENDIIELSENVLLTRATAPDNLNIKTSKLTVVASENLARTEQSVVVIDNSTNLHANGMRVDFEKNKINLLSKVRVTHDPAKVN